MRVPTSMLPSLSGTNAQTCEGPLRSCQRRQFDVHDAAVAFAHVEALIGADPEPVRRDPRCRLTIVLERRLAGFSAS